MSVFADTSFFLALVNPSDDHHSKAVAFAHSEHRLLVVTNAILLELGNALSRADRKPIFLHLLELLNRRGTELVFIEPGMHDRGIELFKPRMDKDWSLTDCLSITLMRERHITDAATTDEHFKQAGFNCLLPTGPG